MSCAMNRKAMTEGRGNYGIMPAIVQCDGRHAVLDTRPLTREQIAAIPGVHFPTEQPAHIGKPVNDPPLKPRKEARKITAEETDKARKLYGQGVRIVDIADILRRNKSTIREMLIRIGVHRPLYQSRIRGEHLAAKIEGGVA